MRPVAAAAGPQCRHLAGRPDARLPFLAGFSPVDQASSWCTWRLDALFRVTATPAWLAVWCLLEGSARKRPDGSGDFEEATASHIHAPVALPDEDCWLLATLEGGIRLQGWRGLLQRMANP